MKLLIFIGYLYFFYGCKEKHKSPSESNRHLTSKAFVDTVKYTVGDTIQPFKELFDSKNGWRAEIQMSSDDNMDLSESLPKASNLICREIEVLNGIREWKFVYTGGDMATVLNAIKIFSDDKLKVAFNIVMDKQTVGLQSRLYGWMPAVNSAKIFETIKKFK